jgi:hypothetical protein
VNVQKTNKYIGIRWMNVLCIIAVLILQLTSILNWSFSFLLQGSLAEIPKFHTPPRISLISYVSVERVTKTSTSENSNLTNHLGQKCNHEHLQEDRDVKEVVYSNTLKKVEKFSYWESKLYRK